MKKNLLLSLAAAALVSVSASAQIAEVSSPRRLLAGVESEMYYPVMNAEGTQVSFTTANNKGLRVYDFNDNVTRKLSDAPSAGRTMQAFKSDAKVTVRTSGSQLFITVNGVEKSYTPIESYAGYLWASVSPDQSKVMFFAAGKGIVITDLKGNILSRPGKYEAPVWYDNDVIVAMDAKDDGHQFKSSRIVMVRADGSQVQPLTRPESMSMFPAASVKAGKIIYNTIDGLLFEMDVKLK